MTYAGMAGLYACDLERGRPHRRGGSLRGGGSARPDAARICQPADRGRPVARGDPVLAARWPAFAGEIPDMLPSFGPRPPRRWPATTMDSSPLVSGVGRAALREASMWLREEGSDPPVRGSAQIVEGHTGRAGSG